MKFFKIFLMIYSIICLSSFALDKFWVANGEKGKWSNSKNWKPEGVPGEGDDVIFDKTGNADCLIDIPVVVTSINVKTDEYEGLILQKKAVKVSEGFYLKGKKGKGRWHAYNQTIETGGDWISEIGLRFGYIGSTIKMTGSGILKGLYFDKLECALGENVIEVKSYIYITGRKHQLCLGSGTIKGDVAITFYCGGEPLLFIENKPPSFHLLHGLTFRPGSEIKTVIPGADYDCPLRITGTVTDTFLVLGGDIKCKELIISSMKKNRTTTLVTKSYNVEVLNNLKVGKGKDTYGILKCGKSHIKIGKNLVIVNENSCVWGENAYFEIGEKIINNGSFVKGNAVFKIKK